MASSDIPTSYNSRGRTMLVPSLSLAAQDDEWEDVTESFASAKEHMAVGEMIHSRRFTLFSAMSAIELMDPKMDVGYGEVRDLRDIPLPPTLSDSQVINIMDHLFSCEMSWLDSHTLPQTVFSCVYTQRLIDVPRLELFSYLRLQLATMDCVVNLIVDEKVAEEEDFVSWTFGFSLPPLESHHSSDEEEALSQILVDADGRPHATTDDAKSLATAVMIRLRFRVLFYKVLRSLAGYYTHMPPFEAVGLIDQLTHLAEQWTSCPHRSVVDTDLINLVFDPSINRRLMTSTPPRTTGLLDSDSALRYLKRILTEFRALLALREFALPPDVPVFPSGATTPRYSLHVAIHAIEMYCAEYNPRVLTRSLMYRLMIMSSGRLKYMFDNENADFVRMVATDMGMTNRHWSKNGLEDVEGMRDGVVSILECFCRNRSRQRRQLLRVLRWWDHCSYMASRKSKKSHETDTAGPRRSGEDECDCGDHDNQHAIGTLDGNGPKADEPQRQGLEGKTPLELVAYEVCCRLMVQHWLLGFECELYHEFEYAAIFFYIGYVLSSLCSSSVALANAGLKDASLHPLRYALYLVDEARLWLSRAFYLMLEALSSGKQWGYSCQRNNVSIQAGRKMFGSEELWYEQRFGVVMGLHNGPLYTNYASFTEFKKMQAETLLKGSPDSDIISLRLKEAGSAFLVARKKLERAKKGVEVCAANMLMDEVLKLSLVAVENSLTVAQAVRQYSKREIGGKLQSPQYQVTFSFSRHHHFPVIQINGE